MIRPIDTQIIHPQTPTIAGQQQRNNHLPVEQQSQFGDIMQKDVDHKKDTVIAPQNAANLKTDQDGSKDSSDPSKKQAKGKKTSKNKSKNDKQKKSASKIDIRI